MARRPINENAMKALEEMKLEIANEINYHSSTTRNNARGMTKNIIQKGEHQFSQNDQDTFNPS